MCVCVCVHVHVCCDSHIVFMSPTCVDYTPAVVAASIYVHAIRTGTAYGRV